MSVFGRFGFVTLLAAAPAAYADSPHGACGNEPQGCVAVGEWNFSIGVGIGARTNPVDAKLLPMVFIPQFSYYGKRFFLDDLDVGYTLFDGYRNQVSVLATPGYDSVFFNGKNLLSIMLGENLDVLQAALGSIKPTIESVATSVLHTPKPTLGFHNDLRYLGGLEWSAHFGPVATQIDALRQAGSIAGEEVRAAIGVDFRLPRGALTINGGGTWKSSEYVDYYYGDIPLEIPGGKFVEPSVALNPFVTLRYSLRLTPSWRLGPYAQYEHIAGVITHILGAGAQPLFDHSHIVTVYLGAFHDF